MEDVVLSEAVQASFVPWWSMVPFAIMLIMIAVGPLFAEKWWSKNSHKLFVSLLLSVPSAVFMVKNGMAGRLEHQILFDYIPFVVLLLTLYVVTGGICIRGTVKPTSGVNAAVLAVGYCAASLIGTTGASMLMIRPLIEINKKRQHKVHIFLFFIALVSNCGGLLTPLGDPPLFMLYLRGASFTWFLTMFPKWLFVGAVLLVLFYVADRFFYSGKESPEAFELPARKIPIRIRGSRNVWLLVAVVASVAFLNPGFIPQMAEADAPLWLKFIRETVLLLITFISYYTTKKRVRYDENKFSWEPIGEVCALFLGIFITMTPALVYLESADMNLEHPWQFFFLTGALSSFLDNTPTAVAFYSVAAGMPVSLAASSAGVSEGVFMGQSLVAGVPELILQAISMGAVFFGALTYIGNGPNFMVKSLAEKAGVKMPSFFAYIFKFSLIVLLPLYVLMFFIFF